MAERSKRELRKFGLVVGGGFLLIGSISLWRGKVYPPIVCLSRGTVLATFGAIAPGLLAPVERGWMKFGEVAGHYNARAILTVLFYLVVTPIGFVLRCFRDPLDRRIADGRSSEWIPRASEPVDPARYREQF